MEVIYLDSIILTELAADFMLLLATDRFCAAAVGWKRLLAGAAVGAVYSVLYVLLGGVFGSFVIKAAFALLMLLAAFGGRRDFLRCAAVFFLCSAAFAGIVLASSVCFGGLGARQRLFSFAAAYALIAGILRFNAARGGTAEVTVRKGGRSVVLTALRDTGSSLRDPISGAATIVAGERELLPLLADDVRSALAESRGRPPELRLEYLWSQKLGSGFRLVPYSSVGVESGFLLAFCTDSVSVGGREYRGLPAAMAAADIDPGGGFTAIINAEL